MWDRMITVVSFYFLRSSGLTIKLGVTGDLRSFWNKMGLAWVVAGVESAPKRALKKWPKSGLTAPELAF
jgi:hypothetical protein